MARIIKQGVKQLAGKNIKIIARNKRANHDYFILDTLECGIVLHGTEIKSIRKSKVSIQESYCQIKNNDFYIYDMHIAKYDQGNIFNHEEKRDRLLLAHKSEIRKLLQKVKLEGATIVPLTVYLNEGLCKVEVALCKGKKNYDKREDMKREETKKEVSRMMKNRW